MAEGTFKPKAIFKKVLSVYDYEFKVANEYSKLIDDCYKSIGDAIRASKELSDKFIGTNELRDMERLEGLMSHASMHAAGVLITNDRVDNHFPVRLSKDENGNPIECSEWHKKIVEGLGAFKFDLLGLKQSDIFDITLKNIEKTKGKKITLRELYNIDYEDPCIYKVLNNNKLSTIFQFTGGSAGNIIRQMKPTCFEDIMVAESICRPGVKEANQYLINRKQFNETGDWEKDEIYPLLEDILKPTYGCIVYQEQTMNIMHKVAGWSLGKADSMRKVHDLEEYREDFVEGAIKNGYTEEQANNIFDRFDLGSVA